MPPLTWQQVSAPSFSGVAESQRLSADMLSNGFGSAIDAVGTFKEAQKSAANGEFLSRIASYGTSEDMRAALDSGALFEGLDRSYITAETFDRADAHSRALLGDIQTGVQTRGFELDNIETGVMTQGERIKNAGYVKDNLQKDALTAGQLILNQGYGLNNDGKRILNDQDQTNLDQDNNDYATTESVRLAQGAANKRWLEIQALAAAGNPAAAKARLAESADVFTAAGGKIEDLQKVLGEISTNLTGGVADNEVVYQTGVTTDVRAIEAQAEMETESLLTTTSNQADAIQELDKRTDMPSEVRVAVLRQLDEKAKAGAFAAPDSSTTNLINDPNFNPSVAANLAKSPAQIARIIGNTGPLTSTHFRALELNIPVQIEQANMATEALTASQAFAGTQVAEGLIKPELKDISFEEAETSLLDKMKETNPDIDGKELRQNIRTLMNNHSLSAGQAMWLIENSVDRETFFFTPFQGNENVNFNITNGILEQLGTRNSASGKWDLSKLETIIRNGRRDQKSVAAVSEAEAALLSAREEYLQYFNANQRNSTPSIQRELAEADKQLKEAVERFDAAIEAVRP